MTDKLSKAEIRKDALQDGVTAASHAVGSLATIITSAVGDIARTLGGLATEVFEIRDSARRASSDHGLDVADQSPEESPDQSHEESPDESPDESPEPTLEDPDAD